MTRGEFVKRYGWEVVADVPQHRFVHHDFPEMSRSATPTEVILWNELFYPEQMNRTLSEVGRG